MAFSDPQTVTINGTAYTLADIGGGENKRLFRTADGLLQLTLSHDMRPNRERMLARLDQQMWSSDPLIPAQNVLARLNTYIVIDRPTNGITVSDARYAALGLASWATSAQLLKLVGGEI